MVGRTQGFELAWQGSYDGISRNEEGERRYQFVDKNDELTLSQKSFDK